MALTGGRGACGSRLGTTGRASAAPARLDGRARHRTTGRLDRRSWGERKTGAFVGARRRHPVPAGFGWPAGRLSCARTPSLRARPIASRRPDRLTFPRRASANFAVCVDAAARRARPCRLGLPSARPSDVPPASISQLRRVRRRRRTSRTALPVEWTGAESCRTGAESRRTGAESRRTGAESRRTGAESRAGVLRPGRLVPRSPGENWATPERPTRVDPLRPRRGRGRSRGG